MLPPSFFIHENSISLGAGQPEASSEVRCAVAPPLLKTCPHSSGQQTAAPGPFPTSGVQGRWPQSECVRTPAGIPVGRPHHSARAGMGRTGIPSHTPRRCQSTPKAPISHPLDVMCFHHCSRLGPAMPRITSQVDHRDSGQGCTGRDPTVLPAPPHTARGAHGLVSQTLRRQLLVHPLPSPSKDTKGEEVF